MTRVITPSMAEVSENGVLTLSIIPKKLVLNFEKDLLLVHGHSANQSRNQNNSVIVGEPRSFPALLNKSNPDTIF